ncbi:DNA cytosine methyltransferase [Rhizobium sp. CFBP 8762]|uniref:DNA cytosine methyltransferase n=1 Tax=Rhizobium sp. CFBP 8762 TaxID=2775279 RepID=UPI00177BC851|nr:DNA cytosine methyltransferase [Rhizobium sp. CFBP 8762]MBD8556319.1 DNA cytosine methyltransferase [Rhizobium sp. CFBP 8762]
MRYGSVCSGIEAASQAWVPLGWTPAFFSEIEAFPSAVLAHHHGSNLPGKPLSKNGVPNHGDMTNFEEWPDYAIDLLVGGPPCQSYSVAGLRKGLDDARGNLMLTYGAIARRYRPRWLVWENVPGVLSSDGGRDFASLLGLLSGRRVEVPSTGWRNAGIVEGYKGAYGLAWRVLDAQYVRVDGFARAVPQRRRRVFVVGYLGDWRRAAAVLFEREGLCGNSAPRREAGQDFTRDVAQCLVSSGRGVERTGDTRGQDNVAAHAFSGGNTSGPIEAAACLTAKGQRIDFEVETFVAQGFAPIAFDCKASGRNGFGVGEIAPTLRAMSSAKSNQNAGGQIAFATQCAVRRLTPTECARLQGFPDDHCRIPWRGKPAELCPDGPQYKGFGNSMSVNVMRWIGQRILAVDEIYAEEAA